MRVLLCGLGSILTNALDYRLRKYGYRSLRATNASEALNRVHANSVDRDGGSDRNRESAARFSAVPAPPWIASGTPPESNSRV